jgi:hypothetical protein
MAATVPPKPKTWQPFLLAVPFTTAVTGLFNLSEAMPTPLAIAVGAVWGVLLGLVAVAIMRRKPKLGAWIEDGLVFAGVLAFALAGCGGLMAILMLNGALESASLTGESLEAMFLPSIPYYIIVNSFLEILVIPAVVYFGWRAGRRRALIMSAVVLYFAMRVWTYLVFVPGRLGWADDEHSTDTMTPADLDRAADDLMLDDPRWAMVLAMLVLFLIAAHLPAVRAVKSEAPSPR